MTNYRISDILLAFYHGFKMDISATGYILILPLLIAIPWFFTGGNWYRKWLKIYSDILLILFIPLILCDAFIYSFWAYRLDFSVIGYLKEPKDAIASATTVQLFLLIVIDIIITFIFIKLCNILIDKFCHKEDKIASPIIPSIVFILFSGFLVIPIRGGLGVAPMNSGSVYFSEHLFLNHAAINVVWNFGYTALHIKPKENPYKFYPQNEAYECFSMLLKDNGVPKYLLNTEKPNILLIILESFGSDIIGINRKDSVTAPRFKEYIPEGIYFSGLYAAGSRTDKAIPAILSGYPNLPLIQVIREPRKTQTMPGLFKLLDSSGYKTSFWYGGDINFASMNSFITTMGFEEKVTIDNFDKKDRNSKWGVHDHILFERLNDSLNTSRNPFAYAVLSLSSHEPFEVPMSPVFKGRDILSQFKNSIYYTDKSLGEFLDRAKKTDWWKNTLIIITSDHCRRNSDTIPVYSESIFKIPMLWLGGAISARDTIITKICCQFDLPLTIASQLKLKANFRFSKNILSNGSGNFAFYTYNEGFGFVTDTSFVAYDIKLGNCPFKRGKGTDLAEKSGKSFLQVLFDDYLSR